MNDGIHEMVQETMGNFQVNFDSNDQIPDEIIHQNTTSFPAKPGILYYVRQTASSRYLRPIPSPNLKNSFIEILHQGDEENEFYQSKDYLKGHEVEYFELAEVISDHFGNKHFPLYPDELNHLSGKDHGWWLLEQEGSLSLSFKTHALVGKNEGIKIGPIGDINIALKRFPILIKKLSTIIPFKNFVNDDRSIQVEVEEETLLYKEFKKIFIFGELSEQLDSELKKALSHTYYYYLLELRGLRRFWKEFENKQYSPLTQ